MAGSGIEYKLTGIDQVIRFAQQLPADLQDLIDDEMNATAEEIKGMAQELVPSIAEINQGDEGGLLIGSIKANISEYLVKDVAAGAHYAAYVEFGTRPLVKVPDALKEYAMQFIGAGPPEIPTVANPYLYPAFVHHIPLFMERVTKLINEELQPPKAPD